MAEPAPRDKREVEMQKPVDMPARQAYGPWWPRFLVFVSVVAALLITAVTGVGAGVLLGVIAMGDTVGIAALIVIRARRHNETLAAAARALLLSEYDRSRLELRSHRHQD